MALIVLGKTQCPLCGNPIVEGQPVVASHFVGAYGEHDLSWFYDAGIHQDCFRTWSLRAEFIRQHNLYAPFKLDSDGSPLASEP